MTKKQVLIIFLISLFLIFKALFIRRDFVLEDSLRELEDKVFNFKIKFVKEPGVDQGKKFKIN